MILLFLSDRERLLENGFLSSALSNLSKGCRRKILFLLEFVPSFSIFSKCSFKISKRARETIDLYFSIFVLLGYDWDSHSVSSVSIKIDVTFFS